ncbi:MAG TPA: NADPH-dependent FMN reductase [Pedobacter sp.]|nr:NADPH-dependent FMN reductase [Pedobacter sp.]
MMNSFELRKILAISGSTRQNSINKLILQSLKENYAGVLHVDLYDSINELPHFNPDDLDALPAAVQAFYDAIASADGVIICSPEYVFSMPGVLKNAIEWTVSTILFSDKPLAIIVASSLGEKAFESLDVVMTTLGASMTPDTKLLISGSNSKIDKQSNSLNTEIIADLNHLMNALIGLI